MGRKQAEAFVITLSTFEGGGQCVEWLPALFPAGVPVRCRRQPVVCGPREGIQPLELCLVTWDSLYICTYAAQCACGGLWRAQGSSAACCVYSVLLNDNIVYNISGMCPSGVAWLYNRNVTSQSVTSATPIDEHADAELILGFCPRPGPRPRTAREWTCGHD